MASAGSERVSKRVSNSTMEVFIEKVKQHTCLWKISEICYRDAAKKELAWEQIARECGMTNSREAKIQWKKLRDSHREALRRRKTATGDPVPNLKPWKYEFLMEFLLIQSENSNNIPQDNQTDKTNVSTSYNIVDLPQTPHELLLSSSSAVEPEIGNRNLRAKRREQRQTERVNGRKATIDLYRDQDALSNLFTSLCQKTRELPKYLQLRVQREIFESVCRAEEEVLSLEPQNSATPTYSLRSYDYSFIKTDPDQTSPLPGASPLREESPLAEANLSPESSTDDT